MYNSGVGGSSVVKTRVQVQSEKRKPKSGQKQGGASRR